MVIHVGEKSHDELTIHAIRDAAVTRDRFAKVLDLESPLQPGREEPTKRGNEGSKRGKGQDVELDRLNVHYFIQASPCRKLIGLGDEDGIGGTFQAGPQIGPQIVDGADEIFVAHEHVGQAVAKDDGAHPRTKETLHRLLGRQLDQLRSAKRDAANIGKDVVCYDQRNRNEEPNQAFKDVVDDKVSLDDQEIEGHVSPSKLGELEPVVALLQRSDEEHEA